MCIPLMLPLWFLALVNDSSMCPPIVPRLHYLHVLPFRLLSLVADTALPVVGLPSSLPGIAVLELVVVCVVGIGLAVLDMVVGVVHATGYTLFPCHVRENR